MSCLTQHTVMRYFNVKRVYGQFCIEMLHESRNRNSTFGGLFVRVFFAKRVQIYCIGKAPFPKVRFCPFLARWRDSFLVLVFATMTNEMDLRSVLLIQIRKQNVKIKYI